MSLKSGLVALGVIAGVAFFGAPSAYADTKIVTINPGDTLSSIATTHGTDYVRVFNANEKIANPDIISAGETLRIPTADEELPDRHGEFHAAQVPAAPQQPATTYSAATTGSLAPAPTSPIGYTGASSAGNTYAWGNCTWYVKNVRPDLPNMLGNGGSWTANAAARGYSTGYTPRVGAVAEEPGHVAYVEAVNADGTISISEMNYAGGLGQVNHRTVPASNYSYIY